MNLVRLAGILWLIGLLTVILLAHYDPSLLEDIFRIVLR